MNTTHSLNPSVAIGLAQKLNTATFNDPCPATTPVAHGKILVLGLVIVASFVATVFVVKAAVIINDLLYWLDLAYKTSGV